MVFGARSRIRAGEPIPSPEPTSVVIEEKVIVDEPTVEVRHRTIETTEYKKVILEEEELSDKVALKEDIEEAVYKVLEKMEENYGNFLQLLQDKVNTDDERLKKGESIDVDEIRVNVIEDVKRLLGEEHNAIVELVTSLNKSLLSDILNMISAIHAPKPQKTGLLKRFKSQEPEDVSGVIGELSDKYGIKE